MKNTSTTEINFTQIPTMVCKLKYKYRMTRFIGVMALTFFDADMSNARIISQILMLYYLEDKNQAEIARLLNLSTSKVNRLLKQARDQGWVEIIIRTPFSKVLDLERQLQDTYGIPEAFIIPSVTTEPTAAIQTLGRAAADYLLQRVRDGDTICISGGKSVHAIVEAIEPKRRYRVRVVPATGARRGKPFTDVNYLAARLAERLGGEAYQLNAPVFVDTTEERETLLSMRHISEVLAMARQAQIAVFGIGSIVPMESSYFDLLATTLPDAQDWGRMINEVDGHGEIFAYVFDGHGRLCLPQYNERVVGLELGELKNIPLSIGVAATAEKSRPLHGALSGGYFSTLITDEITAQDILRLHHTRTTQRP
jgi:DNA-binding transcriptional regulator LsrR (DeoR family)